MGSISASSCRCCIFVSFVHPGAILNAAFCMTYSFGSNVRQPLGEFSFS